MKRTVLIYCLECPLTGHVRYVGKTCMTLMERLSQHLRKDRTDHKTSWLKSLDAVGLKPIITELERIEDSDDTDWQASERFWISYLRFLGCPLTNMEEGGIGGISLSEEHKRKISLGNKGKNLGKTRVFSEETRRKIGAAHKGKVISEEQKAKMRGPRNLSNETRAAMRAAKLGRKLSEETRLKISTAGKGRKGVPMTPEHKAKLIASHLGKPWSEESKEKLRATMKATNAVQRLRDAPRPEHAWNKGLQHTEESRAKMSSTHKARGTGKGPKSPEHREKLRQANLGKKLSAETLEKLRGPRGPNIRTLRKLQAYLPAPLITSSMPPISPPIGSLGS